MSYFEQQLNSDETVKGLRQLIDSISGWMETNGFQNKMFEDRFTNIEVQLDSQKKDVLFLAEFSRGKSELINSTIFGSMGQRFLPSTPGRTTRCTTVLQYNTEELPSIRLLPTLGSEEIWRQPVSMLKERSELWERTLFSPSDPDSVIENLKKLAEVEMVKPEVALELGFIASIDDGTLSEIDLIDDMVAVPRYRHAIINFPHPLLKQGLNVIDTPGLNALGIEPELTLRALGNAHAIVFVVSADTGITRSELTTWNQFVKRGSTENVLVVVNKIDTLWDELKSQSEVDMQIKKQVAEVARILEIPTRKVFPVSAQKSLIARKNNDHGLTIASGINKFEQALADTINTSNRKTIVNGAREEISSCLNAVQRVLKSRKTDAETQVADIAKTRENQNKISDDNLIKVRKERERLKKASEEVELFRKTLRHDFESFVADLDIYALDKLIARYRYEISNKLTSTGLQKEMNQFQSEAVEKFTHALLHIGRLECSLVELYRKIENILGIKGLAPRKIHPNIYLDALKKYNEQHTQYASGMSMVMNEQNTLKDRYHASVMVKIRKLYMQTRDDVELWCRTALVPLELELKEKESQFKKRILNLERVHREDSLMQDQYNVLTSRIDGHMKNMKTINHFFSRLDELARDNKPNLDNVINLQSRSLAG